MICKCGGKLEPGDGAFCLHCMLKAGGMDALNDRQKIRYLNALLADRNATAGYLRRELATFKAGAIALWKILDDISTLNDAYKGNDKAFRHHAYGKAEYRSNVFISDGYKLYFPEDTKFKNPIKEEE